MQLNWAKVVLKVLSSEALGQGKEEKKEDEERSEIQLFGHIRRFTTLLMLSVNVVHQNSHKKIDENNF